MRPSGKSRLRSKTHRKCVSFQTTSRTAAQVRRAMTSNAAARHWIARQVIRTTKLRAHTSSQLQTHKQRNAAIPSTDSFVSLFAMEAPSTNTLGVSWPAWGPASRSLRTDLPQVSECSQLSAHWHQHLPPTPWHQAARLQVDVTSGQARVSDVTTSAYIPGRGMPCRGRSVVGREAWWGGGGGEGNKPPPNQLNRLLQRSKGGLIY